MITMRVPTAQSPGNIFTSRAEADVLWSVPTASATAVPITSLQLVETQNLVSDLRPDGMI